MIGVVIFPWPPKNLSPNARVHWSKRSSSAKRYKLACWALTKERKLVVDWEGPINLAITFFPPNRQQRDFDNALASIKAGLDGLALGMNVNDCRFRITMAIAAEIRGEVEIKVARP